MKLNELAKEIHEINKEKGFHDEGVYNETNAIALIASEAFEMLEAERKGKKADMEQFEEYQNHDHTGDLFPSDFEMFIKDTPEDELAGVVIRTLDYMAKNRIEIKNPLNDIFIFIGTSDFALYVGNYCYNYRNASINKLRYLDYIISSCFSYAKQLNIDLLKHIELKVKYNKTRPKLHGKKF